ncbi:phosphopantetheine-binding protein [Falsirhodobacter sp. alg1]|uniref:phosphopantetheine-binding protein n=1 Tax=Falsirhodobacter sp. alg1 TaxID=1472418 RepID=UPI0005ED75A1|nr:phosphopantetheine-binding protein [Falsirhodobacter sp. alg1]
MNTVVDKTNDHEWIEARVTALLDDEGPIDPDESLIFYGLDSLRVMRLAADLKTRGIVVSFEDLAKQPTLNAWFALIDERKKSDG